MESRSHSRRLSSENRALQRKGAFFAGKPTVVVHPAIFLREETTVLATNLLLWKRTRVQRLLTQGQQTLIFRGTSLKTRRIPNPEGLGINLTGNGRTRLQCLLLQEKQALIYRVNLPKTRRVWVLISLETNEPGFNDSCRKDSKH